MPTLDIFVDFGQRGIDPTRLLVNIGLSAAPAGPTSLQVAVWSSDSLCEVIYAYQGSLTRVDSVELSRNQWGFL